MDSETEKPAVAPELQETEEDGAEASNSGNDTVTDRAREEYLSTGADNTGETEAISSEQTNSTWRNDLDTAMSGMEQLRNLDSSDAQSATRRAELVDTVDAGFQRALPQLMASAPEADVAYLRKGTESGQIARDRQNLYKELGVNQPLSGDDIANGILNAPDDKTRARFTQLATLDQMDQMVQAGTSDALTAKHLPYKVGLEYANFLLEHKNGVTQDVNNPGQPFSAMDVLNTVNSHQMQADGGREMAQRASDQRAANANAVIPDNENPLNYLQQALNKTSPAEAIPLTKQATELADKLDPEECRKQSDALKEELKGATDATKKQELEQKIAAWDSLSHAQGLSNVIHGQVLLQNNPPDFAAARDALLKASKDPEGANQLLDQQGQPLYNSLMMVSLTEGDPSKVVQNIESAGKTMQEAGDLATKASEEKDENKQKELLDEAIKKGNEGLQQAKVLTEAFGGKDREAITKQIEDLKKTPEDKRSEEDKQMLGFLEQINDLGEFEANAKVQLGAWNLTKGDAHAASEMIQDVEKNHPEYLEGKDKDFKAQFDEMKKAAGEAVEDEKINSMSNWNPLKWQAKAADWAGDNWKWVAFGAACVAGAAVTIGTAGAGAGLGVALVAGVGAGTLGGVTAGTAAQFADGERNVFKGMANSVPYALSGSVTGATLGRALAPGALAGATSAAGAETAAAGMGSKVMPFMANMGKGAGVGTVAGGSWNAGDVKENWDAGKYDNFGEAMTDWGTGTAAWTFAGALAGPSAAALRPLAARGASAMTQSEIALNSLKALPKGELGSAAMAGLGLASSPMVIEPLHDLGNGGMAMATGDVPRWLVQEQQGWSRRQYDEQMELERQQQALEEQGRTKTGGF